ncbi:MAG: hypothetical protein ACMUIG_02705 [Thermoplasmatota archaeon]
MEDRIEDSFRAKINVKYNDLLKTERRKDAFFILILFFITCVFFWKVILNPQGMIYSPHSDTVTQFYPWRVIADNALRDGSLPFWNPFTSSGEPLLANPQLAFFYPVNIVLFTILPVHMAFGYSFLLHLFFAGTSAYLISRRIGLDRTQALLAGSIFIFSGYFFGHLYAGHYPQLCSASWMPMVFLLFDMALTKQSKLFAGLTGIALGNQLLAGHVQISLLTGIVLIIYFLFHLVYVSWKDTRTSRKFYLLLISGFAAFIGVLIFAVQFLPTYQYTDMSTRNEGVSYSWATTYSLPPQNLITLLLPNFFGNPTNDSYWGMWNYWELSFYMGIPTLILIPLAYRFRKNSYVKFFSILALISLILALGRYTPIYWVLWKFIPGFDILRVPSRSVFTFIFSCSFLAGFGLKNLTESLSIRSKKRLFLLVKILLIFAALIIMGNIILIAGRGPITGMIEEIAKLVVPDSVDFSDEYSTMIKDIGLLAVILIVTSGLLYWRLGNGETARYFRTAFLVLIIANLGFYHINFIDVRDPDDVYHLDGYLEFLKDHSEGYRVYDTSSDDVLLIMDNKQIIYGIYTIGGYNPLNLEYYTDLTDSIHNLSYNPHHPILDMLSVKYILTSERLHESGFELVYSEHHGGRKYIYENQNALPKAFVVHQIRHLSGEKVFESVVNMSFDPSAEVFVDDPDSIKYSSTDDGSDDIVEIVEDSDNRMRIEIDITNPGMLIMGQSYYPSWSAFINGDRVNVIRTNHALMGVYVEGGRHNITFRCDKYL